MRTPRSCRVQLLVLVEGLHDAEFLRGVSPIIRQLAAHLPNLAELEAQQQLIFVPTSGNPAAWAGRLAGLDLAELHLLDGEVSPTTELRQQIAATIRNSPRCQAFVTRRRSLENYLHPDAIADVGGVMVNFGCTDDVPTLVAQQIYEARSPHTPWSELTVRARRRGAERAKRWLNSTAVSAMTPAQLLASDPDGEIVSWFTAIAEMLSC